MTHTRTLAVFVITLLVLSLAPLASAEPIDTWEQVVGIDCVADRFNPVREDGTKDPNGDPAPGSPEAKRNHSRRATNRCHFLPTRIASSRCPASRQSPSAASRWCCSTS